MFLGRLQHLPIRTSASFFGMKTRKKHQVCRYFEKEGGGVQKKSYLCTLLQKLNIKDKKLWHCNVALWGFLM